MAPRAIDHDESRFPLVVVTWSGAPTDDDFRHFAESQRRLLARRAAYVQIADAENAIVMNSAQRRMVVKMMEETNEDAKRYCRGTVVVVASALVRGAMTAVLWMVKTPYPLAVVGTYAEALAQCELWAREAGLVIPASTRRAIG